MEKEGRKIDDRKKKEQESAEAISGLKRLLTLDTSLCELRVNVN